MRIGIDIRSLQGPYRTGIGTYTAELLNALFKIDLTNEYFLFGNSVGQPIKITWSQPNVHLIYTHYPNKILNAGLCVFNQPKLDTLLAKSAKIKNLDYFFSPHLNFTALSPTTKHIITIHDLTFALFPEFLTYRQQLWHHLVWPKKQCEQATLILTPSENTKRDLITYYKIPESKIKVLYPGITIPPSEGGSRGVLANSSLSHLPEKYILFLGTIEPRKNILALIEAYEMAHTKLTNPISLVIAGAPGWKSKSIFNHINRSPLRKQIHVINYVAPEDKYELYHSASLFVYPSIYEGFGFPVLEAIQAGVPVITTNRSSLPEITDGATYLVNPHRPDELAEGIERILSSPILHNHYSIAGLRQVQKYNWEKTAREWLNYLQK